MLGHKIGRSAADVWIYAQIATKLPGDSLTETLDIRMDVVRRVVTLRVWVPSLVARTEAEALARDTAGVKDAWRLTDMPPGEDLNGTDSPASNRTEIAGSDFLSL